MNDAQAVYCAKCGAPQQAGVAPQAAAASSQTDAAPMAAVPVAASAAPAYATPYVSATPRAVGYGGFWIRFVATIIDWFVIRLAMIPFAFLIMGRLVLLGGWFPRGGRVSPDEMFPMMAAAGKLVLIQIAILWLYEAWMISSSKQGTLGKMVFGLKVVDSETGAPISFGRATGRHFAKYVSAFTCLIGFIIAGFTAKKQALHDLMVSTVVVKTTM